MKTKHLADTVGKCQKASNIHAKSATAAAIDDSGGSGKSPGLGGGSLGINYNGVIGGIGTT